MVNTFGAKPTRQGFGEGLLELGEKNPDVVVIGLDLTSSTVSNLFRDKFPDRFISLGVAEQNGIGVAAGLSLVGKIPYVCTFSVFASGRCWDHLRVSVCYSNCNVKIAGSHSGISVGPDGATHQALEDIALMRVLPNMKIIVPCDYIETKKATIKSAEIPGPVYIRFGREPVPIITEQSTPFVFGKANVLKDGNDVAIISCGSMVYESLSAAEILEEKGIKARVINIHTVKPIDEETIIKSAKECQAIVTAEEHQVMAGFGSAVAEVVIKSNPVPMEFVGIYDKFGESGQPEELLKKYKLKDINIVEAVEKVLKRK